MGLAVLICLYIILQHNKAVRSTKKILSLNIQLHEQSVRDKLTGLCNRRFGEEMLLQLISEADRYQTSFSIAMVDLDSFKSINDEYGHLYGDSYLKHFANIISETIRESDFFIRFGGDEFILIFPKTDLSKVKKAIGNIFKSLEKNPCKLLNDTIIVSVSIGVVEYIQHEKLDRLLDRADKQLYRSKEAGRNTVSFG